MEVTNLSNIPFEGILDCFLSSFQDYHIKIPTDKKYHKQRWDAAKVNFSLSYGMFDNEKLVGFIIHAVDKRFGIQTAFNTATGVIPEYRGRRIVKSIYDFAIIDLRKHGIERSILEVITENEKAIKAYKGVGFEICKEYKCYAGRIKGGREPQVKLRKMSAIDYNWEKLPNQQLYSWDFQRETIIADNYDLYEVIKDNTPESYFVVHPEKHYLAQFDIFNTDKKSWGRLFDGIGQVVDEVKIINVDKRLTDKIDFIRSLELQNIINQYEMELKIADSINA